MSRRQNMSIHDILTLAEKHDLFVSRYKWSHDRLRQKCRRLKSEGKLQIARQDKEGWYYRAVPGAKPGCGKKLAPGQWYRVCGETDMGQTMPALCTECGGEFKLTPPGS